MKRWMILLAVLAISLSAFAATKKAAPAPNAAESASAPAPAAKAAGEKYWVEPMKKVHAKFTGDKGTFAQFGDSITVTMAFWSPLVWTRKNMDEPAQADFALVKGHMKEACWREWKGPAFGSDGGMTIRWALDNVGAWLKKLNPETALLMFGTNDLGPLQLDEYETKVRAVIAKCLDNGTVVILSTIPPKHGQGEKAKTFVESLRRIARECGVPVCDYYGAVTSRRPDDWDGATDKFKGAGGDVYQVPTLISGDGVHPSNPKQWEGDYSEEGLKHNGYVLRNYVVLRSYADVIRSVLK
ncbi:MAG: SGNH/GDSL hydrolase family protein [Planctomycetota bacterium]|nr:SGNH/GDSL hydrolase family protein [Planctomycetota bacterium]